MYPNRAGKPDVFLSYKREDEDFVRRVYGDLKLRGVRSIWLDRYALELGSDWKGLITQAIEACSHMVVFVSTLALTSEEVRYEYELASKLSKIVIPVIIDEILSISDLPLTLRRYNAVSYSPDMYAHMIVELAKTLPRHDYLVPKLLHVEGGPYFIGRPGNEIEVELSDFWISETVVTVSEFACFASSDGFFNSSYWPPGIEESWLISYGHSSFWPSANIEEFALRYPKQPMRGLNWFQAYAYCRWLSYLAGYQDLFRLPSESQWEKAARGTDRRPYPWGFEWRSNAAHTVEAGRNNPSDCGQYSPVGDSPYGCQDMAGNVWEWTESCPIPFSRWDPKCANLPISCSAHVIRGGSWVYPRSEARTFVRASDHSIPRFYCKEIGLRIVANDEIATLLKINC